MALAHHPRVDIAAVVKAHGQSAPIPVLAAGQASHGFAADPIGERNRGRGTARPGAEPSAPAGLRRLGSIDALEADARRADGDAIAIDDAGTARDRRAAAERTPKGSPATHSKPEASKEASKPKASANATSPRVVCDNLYSRI